LRLVLVLATLASLLTAVQLAVSPAGAPARADVSTGTAGLFVPAQGRILDTRYGTGGYSAPLPANVWSTVQVAGLAGVPSTGAASVQVTLTAINVTAYGSVSVSPDVASPRGGTALFYGSGDTGSFSNTAIVAVGANGKVELKATTSVDFLIDVQGYYTAGEDTAAGGFATVAQARIASTTSGVGLPVGRVAIGRRVTVQAGGVAGVPVGASAVFVDIAVVNYGSAPGYLGPSTTGDAHGVSLNFPVGSATGVATAIGTTVPLAADGSFQLYVGGGSSDIQVHLQIDIQGYFDGSVSGGAFTPASTRVLDTRTTSTPIAAGATVGFQIGGVKGVPLAGSGISAVFANLQAVIPTGTGGYLRAWPSDQPEPVGTSNLNYLTNSVRSNSVSVGLGSDGKLKVHNVASFPINLVIDIQGWYSKVGAAIPAGQSRTQEFLTLQAASTGAGAWVTYRYRVGVTGSFADVPVADVTVPGTTAHPAGWPVTKSGSPAAVFQPLTWDAGVTLNHGDQLFQVQACFGSSATDPSPVCSMASTVQLATHAFGDSYATDSVGPGVVSLLTGDYQVSASDVSVPTYQGSLSIGRSLTTLAPANTERADASGVFGPGWSASLPGANTGAADLALVDHPSEGYLAFAGSDGGVSLYQATSPAGSYPVSYAGVDDAAANGATVTKVSAGEVHLLDADGSRTVFTLNSSTHAGTVRSVIEPGTAGTTTFTRDSAGRVTRILGAVPSGVSCAASPDTTPGCRSLTLTYGSVAVGTGTVSRLQSVVFHTYDPVAAAMVAVPVAAYDYDSTGRLAHAWDPRISPNLKTSYSYDANGRLASLTPPGLAPWTMSYDSAGRLAAVSRYDTDLAQTATSTISYRVPFTGSGAPIELGGTATAAWGQTAVPAVATAVFGPNRVPASSPTSTDWPYAELHYLDVNGRETNTAAYGAGAWQYGATNYDSNGNTVSSLTPGNRAQALNPTADTDPAVAALTDPAARAALLSSVQVYDPLNPERVTDSYGPAHPVALSSGATIDGRSHQHTTYDQGAPLDATSTPLPFGLPTTVTTAAFDLTTGVDRDSVTVKTGYSAVAIGGSKTGWDLHQPTSSTTVGAGTGGSDLVANTRYNDAGQTVRSWLPASTGADARSTSTSYYTAAGTGPCVSAALAGLTCTTGPTAQPTTGNPLPVTTTSYNRYDQPLTVTETGGSTVRTTTNSYDAASRPTSRAITVTPTAAGGTALPAVTTSYDSSNGLPTTTTAGGNTLTTDYDSLGRAYRYTDATGNTATTTYDISGRPVSVNDGKGTTSYTYDSVTEHRGLMTAEDIGAGTAPGTFTASYNADGVVTAQTYPNGLVATSRYDNTGDPTALTYTKAGATWMSFTQASNAQGATATQTSPGSTQTFSYDSAGRLIKTEDTTAGTCTTRVYTLDNDSNRQSLKTYPAGTGGGCSTSTTPTTANSTFDAADRLTNTGYSYDTLGRTSTVPAADALGIGSHAATTGDLTLGYYANDFAATQSQGGRTVGFSLDPAQNRVLATTDTAGMASTNHYTDNSDSPAWASTPTGWIRNIDGIAGGLAATFDQTGTVILQLANLHGDIVATCADDPAATGPLGYSESTEYGAPRDPAAAPDSYGWLGTKQRSTNDLAGLTLMGVRLYNPATGRFLSVDPIPGGNDNPYVYPTNPTDQFDLDGRWCDVCRRATRAFRQSVRNQINAPASGLAYVWARAHGGRCKWNNIRGITVCSGMRGGYGRGGTTVGSVFMTGGRTDYASIRHEAKHANQWSWFGGGLAFTVAYGIEEYRSGGGRRNRFERQAGLRDGCYIRRRGC
jgi:RHS repeat-associated protein